VGDSHTTKVDVRVIAATNSDLAKLVASGQFREDLFYRLNVVDIHLPPLRERLEDLPLLIQHFLARSPHASRAQRLSAEALRLLLNYPWPGNVRELENVIERALVLCQGDEITPADLPAHLTGSKAQVAGLHDALARRCTLADLEREYILLALEWTAGKRTDAADILGIDRKTLYRKLAEYSREA
jgi:DNA-binding NtrC family response regulator